VTHTTIISTESLASHLTDGWTIVDCRFDLQRPDWGVAQYQASHVPSAVYASLNDDLAAPPTGTNGRHPLPSVDRIADTFGRLGIRNGMQVVAYDQDSGMYASRLWWMLRYLGHDAVAVLDGGWAKWLREGRPTRDGVETTVTAAFTAHIRKDWCLNVDDVARLVGDPRVQLVDARGPERFEGRTEPLDRVAGHIPGATNHYYKVNVADDGTLLPAKELRASFDRTRRGRTPEEIVMYCGSGVTACHNLLAMEHAGLSGARLYPGSWSEWSADPTRPIATGPTTE
jgi:thiosulfate/3-mercaptopyruvate sulfurtransferase